MVRRDRCGEDATLGVTLFLLLLDSESSTILAQFTVLLKRTKGQPDNGMTLLAMSPLMHEIQEINTAETAVSFYPDRLSESENNRTRACTHPFLMQL
jgi:hypothetical protein